MASSSTSAATAAGTGARQFLPQTAEARKVVTFLQKTHTTDFISNLLFNPTPEEYADALETMKSQTTLDLSDLDDYYVSLPCKIKSKSQLLSKLVLANTRTASYPFPLSVLIYRSFISAIQYFGLWHKETWCMHQVHHLLMESNAKFDELESRALQMVDKVAEFEKLVAPRKTISSDMFGAILSVARLYVSQGKLDKACDAISEITKDLEGLALMFACEHSTEKVETFGVFLGRDLQMIEEQRRWLGFATSAFALLHGELHQDTIETVKMLIDTFPPEDACACAKALYECCRDVFGLYSDPAADARTYLANCLLKTTTDSILGKALMDSISEEQANAEKFAIPEAAALRETMLRKRKGNAMTANQVVQALIIMAQYSTGHAWVTNLSEAVAKEAAAIFKSKGYLVRLQDGGEDWQISIEV